MTTKIDAPGGFTVKSGDRILSPFSFGAVIVPGIVVTVKDLYAIVAYPTLNSLTTVFNPAFLEPDESPRDIENLSSVSTALASLDLS